MSSSSSSTLRYCRSFFFGSGGGGGVLLVALRLSSLNDPQDDADCSFRWYCPYDVFYIAAAVAAAAAKGATSYFLP